MPPLNNKTSDGPTILRWYQDAIASYDSEAPTQQFSKKTLDSLDKVYRNLHGSYTTSSIHWSRIKVPDAQGQERHMGLEFADTCWRLGMSVAVNAQHNAGQLDMAQLQGQFSYAISMLEESARTYQMMGQENLTVNITLDIEKIRSETSLAAMKFTTKALTSRQIGREGFPAPF